MSKLYVCSLLYGCPDIAKESIEHLLKSNIQVPTTFFILDNGSPNRAEMDQVLNFANTYSTPHKVETYVNPTNLGVSGGMNCLYRKAFSDPECEWMVYTAHDVATHPDTIQNFVNRAQKGDAHFITGCPVSWEKPISQPCAMEGVGALFMGHFLQTRELYDAIGGWDENFFPAYFEDNDYHCRIIQAGYHKSAIGTCMGPVRHKLSSTINRYPELNKSFSKNSEYFRKKWGGGPAEVMKRLIDEHGKGVPVKHMKEGELLDGIHPQSD